MRPYAKETIAAIATAPGRGGIGVVRVSGEALGTFAERFCGIRPQPRVATLAKCFASDGALLDSGLVLYFPSPNSFTGEDVFEFQGHGGIAVMHAVLARCLECGARLANPGEFSERAFFNDKMDLAQAEAVADLIEATSVSAARSAMRSLDGEFSRVVRGLVKQLTELRMLIEATLDFPEEEIDVLRDTDSQSRLDALCVGLREIQVRARQGSVLRSGIHVVLTGLPNVGKSSLLNALAGIECAIVTDIAGTTRDAIRETIEVDGIPLHIIDTAGLRETSDVVERVGIERAWREIENADVVLQLVDARAGVTPADHAIAVRLPTRAERVVVENKMDLAGLGVDRFEVDGRVHVRLCAKTGHGVEVLRRELLRIAGWEGGGDVILARERHLQALSVAGECVLRATGLLSRVEFCAEELRRAQVALGSITGEVCADDLLGEIFSRFCIGK